MVMLWLTGSGGGRAEMAQLCLGGNKIRKEKMSGKGGEEVVTPFKPHHSADVILSSPVLRSPGDSCSPQT